MINQTVTDADYDVITYDKPAGNLELCVHQFRHNRRDARYILPYERDSNYRDVEVNRFTDKRKIQELNDVIPVVGDAVAISSRCLNRPGTDCGLFMFKGTTLKPIVASNLILRIYNRILNFKEV